MTIANGTYNHMSVPVGTWTLRAEKEGFMPATQSVTVTEGGMYSVDLTLTPE